MGKVEPDGGLRTRAYRGYRFSCMPVSEHLSLCAMIARRVWWDFSRIDSTLADL